MSQQRPNKLSSQTLELAVASPCSMFHRPFLLLNKWPTCRLGSKKPNLGKLGNILRWSLGTKTGIKIVASNSIHSSYPLLLLLIFDYANRPLQYVRKQIKKHAKRSSQRFPWLDTHDFLCANLFIKANGAQRKSK